MSPGRRPSPADLEAAVGRAIPDVVAGGLTVLFCGINPGLWSGAVGHHFARPGNRFWRVLHASGFTPELVDPLEDHRLLDYGLGITNLVARATRSADELTTAELVAGAARLVRTSRRYRPQAVAVVGMGAYRTAFGHPKAPVGEQPEPIGSARAFVLPNPSGLQAHYQLGDLVEAFSAVRLALAKG